MHLKSFYDIQLNANQEQVVHQLESFLQDPASSVFLLKGYAGTGKTTLVQGLIKKLGDEGIEYLVCAPTGRAAKVLRNKTGAGKTIHSTIYDFENLITKKVDKDVAEQSYEYIFPIKSLENHTVIIVDEASMVSSKMSKMELFDFGSNYLLQDLMTFAQLQTTKNKIIFIGDPAQLPPVGDNNSWALEKSFFEERKLNVQEVFLTEIMRQSDNLVLENATRIRNCIENSAERNLKFSFDDESFIDLSGQSITELYCHHFSEPSFDSGVIINFSNAQNYHNNKEIRERYFPGFVDIQVGDIVQIINNNYHKYQAELYNGDFAQITEVGGTEEKTAPVIVDRAGEKVREQITLKYRRVKLRLPDFPEEIEGYINESLLNSTQRDLTIEEMKSVYINAIIRFRQKNPDAKINSEQFKDFLKNDSFYNAIRVKYGYSITGHKSQGGEWNTVFVDYFGRTSLKKEPLRWCYTVTTRAKEKLLAINFPNFGRYHKLSFSAPAVISKLPVDALDFSKVPVSPYHSKEAHGSKNWLYWNIDEKLQNSEFRIDKVISEPYREKYIFTSNERITCLEIDHKGSGVVSAWRFTSGSEEDKKSLEELLYKKSEMILECNYTPTEDFTAEFYNLIQASCNDAGINLVGVKEYLENYFVNYFFEKDGKYAQIQFYFDKNKNFSKGIVKSFSDFPAELLEELTHTINQYASVSTN